MNLELMVAELAPWQRNCCPTAEGGVSLTNGICMCRVPTIDACPSDMLINPTCVPLQQGLVQTSLAQPGPTAAIDYGWIS